MALAAIAMVAPAQNLKVNVPMPGGLASLVGDRLDVEKLTVTGIINDSDFRFIRSLTKLKEVNLRKLKNTQIGDSAFYGMKTLESVRLPRRLVLLGVSAFEGCESLTSIEFPGHLQTLPDYMLKGCRSIDKVYIHNTHVMHIGKGAFMDSGIRLIGLSPDLRTIGPMAFANCKRLQVISIPQWVTEIGSLAFANCVMLRSIIDFFFSFHQDHHRRHREPSGMCSRCFQWTGGVHAFRKTSGILPRPCAMEQNQLGL